MKRTVALLIGAGRVALGAALAAQPERFARGWLGEEAGKPVPQALVTGLGVRDVMLGLALLGTGGSGPGGALLLLAGAGADIADIAGTFRAGSAIPVNGRVGTLALAGGAALAAGWAAPGLIRREPAPA